MIVDTNKSEIKQFIDESNKDINDVLVSAPQSNNQEWWQENPMTYDWEETMSYAYGSREWYEEVDRRFHEASYFAKSNGDIPFGRFMRPEIVKDKDVLEVGCGMGTHASMLIRSGARLTAIDLTERAIAMTRRRLELFGLQGTVRQADAEHLPFADNSFDTVWSWGVIHHSSSFDNCLNEIKRVLRPGGNLMLMVYYKPSLAYYLHCGVIRGVLMGGFLRGKKLHDIYVQASDGFYARVFTKSELRKLLIPDFEQVKLTVFGLKAELFPIPRNEFKVKLEDATPDGLASTVLSRFGSMIVAEAVKR